MSIDHQPGPAPQTLAVADDRDLRATFSAFPTGVTVVTVGGDAPHGMTANAFSAVSLDPPLLLVCVQRDAQMHRSMLHTDTFAVSVLAAGQGPLARYFASSRRPSGSAQFAAVDWSPGANTGAPLINGALAWLECTMRHRYEGGDHSIFLGQPVAVARRGGGGPLLFHDSMFRQLGSEVPDGR